MSEEKNLNGEAALNEEELDAVTGGFGLNTRSENGSLVFTCGCGTAVTVPEGIQSVRCPHCGCAWRVLSNHKVIPDMC